jgi:adenosylcobinamide-GDP ribazoletransferase
MSKAGTTPVRQSLIGDCAAAFVLLSRLPTGWYRFPTDNPPNFTSALWAFPVVGLVIGGAAGLVLSGAVALSLPPLAAAALAIFASLLLSGAIHEDGLADMADGFGGGHDTDSKIRIMHDSRIGSYGVMALVLASLARTGLLIAATAHFEAAALVLIIALAHAGSRFLPSLQLAVTPVSPHAKLASLTGHGGIPRLLAGLAIWGVPMGFLFGWATTCFSALLCFVLAISIAKLAQRQVGGLTGDVMGATIILGEMLFLAAVLISVQLPLTDFGQGLFGV